MLVLASILFSTPFSIFSPPSMDVGVWKRLPNSDAEKGVVSEKEVEKEAEEDEPSI